MTAVETIKKVIESYKLTKINSEQMIDEILELIDSNCLELEKQQIIDAYDNGIDEAYSRFNCGMNMSYWEAKDSKQYYEKTFKNK